MTKRSEGKYKGCLTIRDIYKAYKVNTPKEKQVEYKIFSDIIKRCNTETIRVITQEAETVRLPLRLGLLKVTKYERSYDQPQHKWAMDFKASKEQGFKVYHDQTYIYKWEWRKKNSTVRNKSKYKFIACREAKREIPKALKTNKIDYYG